MSTKIKPSLTLSKKTLPEALTVALVHIFSQNIKDVMLVGGTALSGFYAGHRRSDDLDLFVKNEVSFKSTLLAVKSLQSIGAHIQVNSHSNQYFNAICRLQEHTFTVDIVLDENIFKVGHGVTLENKVTVVDITTLFKMKSATLLSRCSEKDLFDLNWLFENTEAIDISFILEQGKEIDGGMDPETLLFSISTAILREDACGFSEKQKKNSKVVFKTIRSLQNKLIKLLNEYLENLPTDDLKKVIARIKKL